MWVNRVTKNQAGAAMLTALLILLAVTIIGVAALRGSVFNSKIATSARASMMTFQAAESGLAVVLGEASGNIHSDTDNLFNIVSSQLSLGALEAIERCITEDQVKTGACANADRYDSAGYLQSSARLAVNPAPQGPCSGNVGQQVSTTGSDPVFSNFQFAAAGQGRMPDMDLENHNIQEFTRCSPGGATVE